MMESRPRTSPLLSLPVLLGLAAFALHAATAVRYGIFRDELYYLACAEHLAAGYVDHPPLIAFITAFVRRIVGDALFGLRMAPALAAGLSTGLAVAIARRLGGGRYAQALTGLCVALAPVYLGLFSFLSMNAFDVLFWAALWWTMIRILSDDDPRLWMVFGLLAGLGLLNKLSVLYLGAGILAGLLLTPARRHFGRWWIWVGGVIAGLVFAPHVVWQIQHDWPTLEFIQNAQSNKILALGPLSYLSEQLLLAGPVAVWLAVAGLAGLLVGRLDRRLRPLGWACLIILGILLAGASKPYYLSPVYTLLFAAGAVLFERGTAGRFRTPLRSGLVALVLVSGLLAAPLAKPMLPVESFLRYEQALGVRASSGENNEEGPLPQLFADRFGWEALADTVASVYHGLSPDERRIACIGAQNYGQAGAIDFFGPERGLPPAISGHNSYWMWGPRGCSGEVLIVIGDRRETLETLFEEVVAAGVFRCTYCMPYEDEKPIWICRRPRTPLQAAWPDIKHFI